MEIVKLLGPRGATSVVSKKTRCGTSIRKSVGLGADWLVPSVNAAVSKHSLQYRSFIIYTTY